MEKQKRWQLALIVTVLVLTLYNILPTLLYYTKPLKSPIDEKRSEQVAYEIMERVNALDEEATLWLKSFTNLIKVHPTKISPLETNSQVIEITLANGNEATLFRKLLPAASELIPFIPARLSLYPDSSENPNTVLVERAVGITLEPSKQKEYFQYVSKLDLQGNYTKEYQEIVLDRANELVKYISVSSEPSESLKTLLKRGESKKESTIKTTSKKTDGNTQEIPLGGKNPFIEAIVIHWDSGQLSFKLYDDITSLRQKEVSSEEVAFTQEKVNQLLINEIAKISNALNETIIPYNETFAINLFELSNPTGFLKFSLDQVAKNQTGLIEKSLSETFNPKSKDLTKANYPIRSFESFQKESAEEKKFGFVVYAPAIGKSEAKPKGFNNSSIYVVAKGLESMLQKYKKEPTTEESKEFAEDLKQLGNLMQNLHFIGYSGASFGIDKEFANDFIFELGDYYGNLLKATREDFSVKANKKYAILPFTDVEQRILTENKIADKEQEDLLKWVDAYNTAQVDETSQNRYLIPAPTKNPFWSNFKISFAKYFRGDDRKILKWGLDLSGGKTVRIGLSDQNGKAVTNPDDVKQAVNELYTRINKMGVSERTIRIENNNIVLEFPGSQNLSATDLVKASAMYFHLVNEKFSPSNSALKNTVNQFLQNVWNEAVVTNKKSIDQVKEIAWNHLGGAEKGSRDNLPISDEAKALYKEGLRLQNPREANSSNSFDDTLSTVAMFGGDDFSSWQGQTHPLLFVFNNYALEGSSLSNIQVGFDSTEGNTLSFSVKSSYDSKERRGSPRDDFYAWTSQFAEDKIAGTPKEAYTNGRGYRMAVILNGTIVTSPALRAALKDNASISGKFTQREINKLAADLKAGSLTFTPKILSEQNVSAELGKEERAKGIGASILALCLVVVSMVVYYRFAGVVASVAVLFNILIMWGVLQNLGAALTLPSIAGIVLTIGMAIDANVLVFERFREEFAISGRIASAIHAGYRKAFSAIVDSNITTIIAALILVQFDSGPIKGFAITLIVGIVSSMFTALFMTRYFFAGWVQNPANKSLYMMQFFAKTNFDFLKASKMAIIISIVAVALGSTLLYSERKTLFGMDFTGGYSMSVEVEASPSETAPYRIRAQEALLAAGASGRDVQVRELTHPNQLRIQLGIGMEEKNAPFYQMPERIEDGKFNFEYEKNPRIVWVVKALESHGIKLSTEELSSLENNWTVMSGQFSETMRNNAIYAIFFALLSILIYITVRFEFKYAVAAVVGLAHDVVITLGILALFHALGFLVQIDLQVIGAIMTIIGYSLNDTIIVFDRIREDLRIMRRMTYKEIINHALNVTLSRTVMTSGTTLLVLLALVFFGGHSIFAFSLVMTIGVIVGTLSSLFIATPMLLYMHNLEEEKHLKEKNA